MVCAKRPPTRLAAPCLLASSSVLPSVLAAPHRAELCFCADLRTPSGKQKKIQFEFNRDEDTPAEVAVDLTDELKLNAEQVQDNLTKAIEQAVASLDAPSGTATGAAEPPATASASTSMLLGSVGQGGAASQGLAAEGLAAPAVSAMPGSVDQELTPSPLLAPAVAQVSCLCTFVVCADFLCWVVVYVPVRILTTRLLPCSATSLA
jgi:hypothetical protein